MAKPYTYVRFTWWREVELKEVAEELKGGFTIEPVKAPRDDIEISLYKDMREELRIKSDTLVAYLSPIRVTISQKTPAKFTKKDLELRKRLMELYPRDRPTPFPWEFSREPKFEVEE